MENKIDLAELLKDCPSGMELNCMMYDNLHFDSLNADYYGTISCYTLIDGIKTSINFTKYGTFNNHTGAKCVIFPKGKTTWEGFVPPYQFKDGDVIFKDNFVAIVSHIESSGRIWYHCWYNIKYNDCKFKNDFGIGDINDGNEVRFATKEEKQKLFDTIKENGYEWNSETRTLKKLPKFKVGDKIFNIFRKHMGASGIQAVVSEITDDKYIFTDGSYMFISNQDNWELVSDKFDITTLVPFKSEVLVRYGDDYKWEGSIFTRFNNDPLNIIINFITIGGVGWRQCIPYKGNEHLLGTSDDCDDFYKTWKK